MRLVRDQKSTTVAGQNEVRIPVVDLDTEVPQSSNIGDIVFDTASNSIVPCVGGVWERPSVEPVTLYLVNLSNCAGLLTFGADVTQDGSLVHVCGYDVSEAFSTTGIPAVFQFSLPVQTTQEMITVGQASFSSAAGTATGIIVAGGSTYSTGTASQTATVLTGVGTTFTPLMVGGTVTFANGETAVITSYISATSLIVEPSQTVASGTYSIQYSFATVELYGPSIPAAAASILVLDFSYLQL